MNTIYTKSNTVSMKIKSKIIYGKPEIKLDIQLIT